MSTAKALVHPSVDRPAEGSQLPTMRLGAQYTDSNKAVSLALASRDDEASFDVGTYDERISAMTPRT